MIMEDLSVSADGRRLCMAGQDTVELARTYGTPLYVMDEDRIRARCRLYRDAFARNFVPGSKVLYASKANCFKQMYRIMAEEGMGIDVVSSGEIYTASQAGYDLGQAYFHSNGKTDADVAFAMDHGVGYFVVDNYEELDAVSREASRRGITQKILLRITPGIDPHTYEAVSTGKVDSKFGVPIETGQAKEFVGAALHRPGVALRGFHCHVGSQVFAEDVFERASRVMLHFIADMKRAFGYEAEQLDLGGGFGVRYVDSDPQVDIPGKLASVGEVVRTVSKELGIAEPKFLMEPGRSIVADSSIVLYTVQSVKRIPGYKNYVCVDGGMTDSPRYALYKAKYTLYPADKMDEARDFTASVVGRLCESGDIIQERVPLPSSVARGDLIALCVTGAYHYAMASNYNRLPRPATVMLHGGTSSVAVRRESFEDLVRNDV